MRHKTNVTRGLRLLKKTENTHTKLTIGANRNNSMPNNPNAQTHNNIQRIPIVLNGSNWTEHMLLETSQTQNSKN